MKNKGKIVLAVFVSLAIVISVIGGVVHWRNSESDIEIPAVTERRPSEAIFVRDFTDMRVTDSNSAIVAVLDYLDLIGTDMSFQPRMEHTTNYGVTTYRLAQYYRGIPVFNRDTIVSVNEDGEAFRLGGNPLAFSGISTIPTLSVENALARARELFGGNINARNVGMVIYTFGVDPVLCYKMDVSGIVNDNLFSRTIFICASTGELISSFENIRRTMNYQTRPTVGQTWHGHDGFNYDLPYTMIDGEPVKFCEQRNIIVYSMGFESIRVEGFISTRLHSFINLYNRFSALDATDAIRFQDNNRSAADAFGNTIVVYDFFAENLSWIHMNNNPYTVLPVLVDILTTHSNRNAIYWLGGGDFGGIIGFEVPSENHIQFSVNLDVVAHEFVHGVNWATWGGQGGFEAHAIDEALADIFGEIIEHYHTGHNDWRMASISYNNEHVFLQNMENYVRNFYDGQNRVFDNRAGRHHYNSVILSWIAREIARDFDFSTELITYAQLWHGVQHNLPHNPTFEDFANTTVEQAQDMLNREQITERQFQAVRDAFVQNGIVPTIADVGQAPTAGGEGALQQQGNDGETTGTAFTTTPMVVAGGGHTIALRSDGTVWAWGYNGSGQLGIGSSGRDMFIPTPVRVPALDNIKAISAGGFHSLALHNDGTVWAFGSNGVGQLGNGAYGGSGSISSIPVQVSHLSNIIAISAGSDLSMALRNDGTVWAWGSGYSGQLGHRSEGAVSNRNTPVQIQGLNNITAISAGGHSVASQNNDTVFSLGNNRHGQLGNGSGGGFGDGNNYKPTQARNLNNVIAIEAGGTHTLALRDDGTVWAWGTLVFAHARLADGSPNSGPGLRFHPNHLAPMQVPNVSNIIAITAGNQNSFILRNDGTVWAWGWNASGKLGDGTTIDRDTPVQVVGLNNAMAISAGSAHTVALRNDGTIWAWGGNSRFGQLGDGTTTNRYTPTQVVGENGVGHFNVFAMQ